jgi:hypothetical protein
MPLFSNEYLAACNLELVTVNFQAGQMGLVDSDARRKE